MTRRGWLFALALVAGCSRQAGSLKDKLPVHLQRTWVLEGTENIGPETAPELVRTLGLKQALNATYKGNGTIKLGVYEMTAETSAFELIQKWRQSDGLAIYKGSLFIVARGEGVPNEALSSFLQSLRDEVKA